MKRFLKWAVLVVLVLVVAGGLIVYFSLNSIVKSTVEKQATSSLALETKLDSANMSLFGGKLNLDDLTFGSPKGFGAPYMLTLDDADVAVKLGELRKEPVHISSVTLNKPKLVIERANNQFNFKAAMDQMPPSDPNPMKLVIDDLTVKDAVVVIRPGIAIPGISLPEEITLTVPTVNLKNIGNGDGSQNGAAMKDVVMQVITVLAADAANSGKLPDQLKALMNVDVNGMVAGLGAEAQKRLAAALPGEAGKVLSGLIADPGALMKDPGKAIEQGLRDQGGKAIGDLLGGRKSPEGAAGEGAAGETGGEVPGGEVGKSVEKGLRGLLDRGKKEKDRKAEPPADEPAR